MDFDEIWDSTSLFYKQINFARTWKYIHGFRRNKSFCEAEWYWTQILLIKCKKRSNFKALLWSIKDDLWGQRSWFPALRSKVMISYSEFKGHDFLPKSCYKLVVIENMALQFISLDLSSHEMNSTYHWIISIFTHTQHTYTTQKNTLTYTNI